MIKNLAPIAVLLALSACQPQSEDDSPKPETPARAVRDIKIDISTPDKAIRSYWQVRDAARAAHQAPVPEVEKRAAAIELQLSKVSIPNLFDGGDYPIETFDRDIVSVDIESESRAAVIAIIRNSTPVPQGADLSEYDRKERANGARYKYIFERDASGWKVAEIWVFDDLINRDWQKQYPRSTRPSAPTLTFDGA